MPLRPFLPVEMVATAVLEEAPSSRYHGLVVTAPHLRSHRTLFQQAWTPDAAVNAALLNSDFFKTSKFAATETRKPVATPTRTSTPDAANPRPRSMRTALGTSQTVSKRNTVSPLQRTYDTTRESFFGVRSSREHCERTA